MRWGLDRRPIEGDIALARIDRLAGLGVDLMSIGALTHSATAVDLSLLVEIRGRVSGADAAGG